MTAPDWPARVAAKYEAMFATMRGLGWSKADAHKTAIEAIARGIAAALKAQAEYDWDSSPNLSAEDSRRWHAERHAATARAFEEAT